jgi:predicted site-specific integrase-resolvase
MGAQTYFTRLEAATQLGIGLRQLGRYQDTGLIEYSKAKYGRVRIRFTQKQIDDCKARLNTYVPASLAS